MKLFVALSLALTLLMSCTPSPRYNATHTYKFKNKKKASKGHTEKGIASWYGRPFHGRTTANGEKYNMRDMTAAHKTLPFGTMVKVTDVATGRSVKVRINDRGPYKKGRIIDLSRKAAEKLGIRDKGTAKVRLRVIK